MKVTKSDLITTGRIGFVLDVFLFAYVFIASYFPLFLVLVSIPRSFFISVGVSFLELTILPGVPSIVIGVAIARKRASFLVGRDFRTVHAMRTINRYSRPIFTGLFFVVSAVLVLALYGYLMIEVLSLIVVWLVAVELMAFGIALAIYLDILAPKALARLYFGYANDLKDHDKEVAAIREAFKQLRIDAAHYGLELNTSRFEQLLATRLYKGKDVKDELAGLMRHLSDGDPIIVALKELAGDSEDFLALAKIEQKWRSFLEWIAKLLVPIASAVAVLLVQRFL